MKPFEQATVVLRLAEALKERGSWAGETHVQKAMYFLQELLGVPTGFEFILYKHGPFSFDLRATLTFMEAENLIGWQPRPYPYGPTLISGDDVGYLDRHYANLSERFARQISFVADRLAGKSVKDLEKLATALYVSRSGGTERQRVHRIIELKPHIRYEDAIASVAEVDRIVNEATVLLLSKTA